MTLRLTIPIFLLALHSCEQGEKSAPTEDVKPIVELVSPNGRPLEAGNALGKFTKLPADETGIDFIYQMEADGETASSETAFASGGGVAIGDYDGDQKADIYLTRPHGGGRLYRNLGKWKFKDVTGEAGLGKNTAWGSGCTFADIDNDGDLDLYVCGYATPNRMFINQGDGTFKDLAKELGLANEGASVMMSFADYDLDGDLDAFLVRNRYHLDSRGRPFAQDGQARLERDPFSGALKVGIEWAEQFGLVVNPANGSPQLFRSGQPNLLFRNDGPDGFAEVSVQAGLADKDLTLSATWWDYDRDGFPDLYLSSDFYGSDHLYRNKGDGTFEDLASTLLPHTPWFSMGADFADINNDGLMDFFASDMAGSTHYKSKMGMGDMEDTGWFLETGTPRQYMRNALYLNSGAGPFMEIAHQAGVAASDWTWSPKFADFDGDGWIDLFITNGMTADLINSDVTAGLAKPDSKPKRDANMAFRNRGDLSFENVGEVWNLGIESVSFGAACGDLDNDGDPDLVVNEWQAPCSIFRNDLNSSSRVKIELKGSGTRPAIGAEVRLTAGGITQTRQLHLAHGFMSSDEPVLHFGLGSASAVEKVEVIWPGGGKQIAENLPTGHTYTFNAPQIGGATERTNAAPTLYQSAPLNEHLVHRENEFDDFSEQPLLPNRLSLEGPPLAVGDLDADGTPDLVLGGAAEQTLSIWLSSEKGFPSKLEKVFADDHYSEDTALELFDVEGDGDLDLYIVSGGYEFEPNSRDLTDRLYLNDGNGHFEKSNALPENRDSGSCVTGSDFDGDGDLDLFIGGRMIPGRYPEIPRSRLLRNDSTSTKVQFTELEFPEVGMVTAAVWADIDNDQDPDLLLALDWGPIKLFQNNEGKLEEVEAGLQGYSGWWRSLATADLDEDGDLDLIAGNFGLNSKYHPKPDAPVSIYYGDFEGLGKPQIVEAAVKGGKLLPIRGKSCSQNAIPSLRRKFPTFHQFASSLLPEIYSEEKLDQSLKLEVNELRSGIFLNQGKGQFKFSPLPPFAQISPCNDIAVLDSNGDGHDDLFLAQNFYGPQRESGRMDGGLSALLIGDGKGHFAPMWPNQSGLIIRGDTRSAAAKDLNQDGYPDLIVSQNNGPARVFLHQGNFPKKEK